MPDWTKSMRCTFEYYVVDPINWMDAKRIDTITSSSIERDATVETKGSASFTMTEPLDECYIRTYLVTSQNGVTERFVLGTHLIQTPSVTFNGMRNEVTADAYTPLIELKDQLVPLGYSILKAESEKILLRAYNIAEDAVRVPVIKPKDGPTLNRNFVATSDDTWLSYISSLVEIAKYQIDLDELGKITFSPIQEIDSLAPVWTFDDDNSSILQPSITLDKDLYGIPNAVEVIYSEGTRYIYRKVVNKDPDSKTSTVNRGREILYRDTNPSIPGTPTGAMIEEYANKLLEQLSTVECTLTYTHGYCPVRVGDCVRLNYGRAGLVGIKAQVRQQSISCTPSCQVSETAVYIDKLWTSPKG